MKCEACGGDGLIEVGAYRGDDSPETRTCSLCGGVVTLEVYREQVSGERKVTTVGAHLDHLAQRAGYADIHGMVDGKRASSPSASGDIQTWAREVAAKETVRLRQLNANANQAQRARQLKLIATCWYRGPDDSADTLRHCRGIESTELIDGVAEFKPAESDERITHVKICAAQQSGSCVFPLAGEAFVAAENTITMKFGPSEMQMIISTFVK